MRGMPDVGVTIGYWWGASPASPFAPRAPKVHAVAVHAVTKNPPRSRAFPRESSGEAEDRVAGGRQGERRTLTALLEGVARCSEERRWIDRANDLELGAGFFTRRI